MTAGGSVLVFFGISQDFDAPPLGASFLLDPLHTPGGVFLPHTTSLTYVADTACSISSASVAPCVACLDVVKVKLKVLVLMDAYDVVWLPSKRSRRRSYRIIDRLLTDVTNRSCFPVSVPSHSPDVFPSARPVSAHFVFSLPQEKSTRSPTCASSLSSRKDYMN